MVQKEDVPEIRASHQTSWEYQIKYHNDETG